MRELDENSYALYKLFDGYRRTWEDLQKAKAEVSQELREQYATFKTIFDSLCRELAELHDGEMISEQRWQLLSMEAQTFRFTVQTQLADVHRKFGVVERAYTEDRSRFTSIKEAINSLRVELRKTQDSLYSAWRGSQEATKKLIHTIKSDL